MTHPLSRVPVLGKFVDERFLEHRRKSTSAGGIAGAVLAACLFEYHLLHDHAWHWDLFAVVMVIVMVKMGMMLWYRFND